MLKIAIQLHYHTIDQSSYFAWGLQMCKLNIKHWRLENLQVSIRKVRKWSKLGVKEYGQNQVLKFPCQIKAMGM